MASVTIDIDLPEGITITSYQRWGEAHGFEVDWAWPQRWRCPPCSHEEKARWEAKLATPHRGFMGGRWEARIRNN